MAHEVSQIDLHGLKCGANAFTALCNATSDEVFAQLSEEDRLRFLRRLWLLEDRLRDPAVAIVPEVPDAPRSLREVLRFAHYAASCMLLDAGCEEVERDGLTWINLRTAKECLGDSEDYLQQAGLLQRHAADPELVRVEEVPRCAPEDALLYRADEERLMRAVA